MTSYLLVIVASCVLLVVSWTIRIHDVRDFNRRMCRHDQQLATALRLVINARLADPSTPEAVKARFRGIVRNYLVPVNCN